MGSPVEKTAPAVGLPQPVGGDQVVGVELLRELELADRHGGAAFREVVDTDVALRACDARVLVGDSRASTGARTARTSEGEHERKEGEAVAGSMAEQPQVRENSHGQRETDALGDVPHAVTWILATATPPLS